MDAHQFRDLPQIDEARFTVWAADHNSYVQPYKQYAMSFGMEEEIYFDEYDNGMVSMQPMQRFMADQSIFTPGMLHAKTPFYGQYERQYEQQWPSVDHYRNVSPDRTSISGNSSYANQSELRSPHVYHPVSHGSPMECSQSPLPYPSTEHFQGGSYLPQPSGVCSSISLREIEYEHHEPEPVVEEVEVIETKNDIVCNHDHCSGTMEITPARSNYADSGIGHSVRDAESVQPVGMYDEPTSDSEYSPSSRGSGKRRRSSASNSSSSRAAKRHSNGRKDSQVSIASNATSPVKRPRRTSNTIQGTSEVTIPLDDRRPFPCPFAAYGCSSNFSSKNEWKRHVSTQHIKLGYWRCDLCPPTTDPSDESVQYYNDFNRKDLFTQHLRRMHAAPKSDSHHSQKEYPVNEDNLPEHQQRCFLSLRTPPQQSRCLFCLRTFDGPTSWEERMEHVGRHLEKDRKNGIDMLDFAAWNLDHGLEQYLIEEGLITREAGVWKIGDGKPRRHVAVDSEDDSEEE